MTATSGLITLQSGSLTLTPRTLVVGDMVLPARNIARFGAGNIRRWPFNWWMVSCLGVASGPWLMLALGEGAVGDSFLVAVIDVVPMVILVVAFVMSAWVFAPIRSVESVPGSDPTPNLLFFSHVAGSFGSGRAYGAAMESLSELRGGLNRHLAAQVWAMSVVATRKMDRASQALLVTLLGLVFALALLARSRI